MGPAKCSYFYLYVIIDIFSRRIAARCIADAESAALFKPLFDDAVVKHNVAPGQLTLHADRGGPMKAKATALMLADLGVTKSHSRPYTSNDNPFSESHFKTLKYQPQFPHGSAASRTQTGSLDGQRVPLFDPDGQFSRNYNRYHFEFQHLLKGHPLFELPSLIELSRRPYHRDTTWANGSVSDAKMQRLSLQDTIANIADNDSQVFLKHVEQDPVYASALQEVLRD